MICGEVEEMTTVPAHLPLSPQSYGTGAPLKLLLNCHILVVSHRENSESSPCAVNRAAWKLAQALYFTPAAWVTQRSSVILYCPFTIHKQRTVGQCCRPSDDPLALQPLLILQHAQMRLSHEKQKGGIQVSYVSHAIQWERLNLWFDHFQTFWFLSHFEDIFHQIILTIRLVLKFVIV